MHSIFFNNYFSFVWAMPGRKGKGAGILLNSALGAPLGSAASWPAPVLLLLQHLLA